MQLPLFEFLLILFLSFKSHPVQAYLDPGSISLALQAVTAAIAGAVLTWKHWYWRFLNWFDKKKESEKSENHNLASPGDE